MGKHERYIYSGLFKDSALAKMEPPLFYMLGLPRGLRIPDSEDKVLYLRIALEVIDTTCVAVDHLFPASHQPGRWSRIRITQGHHVIDLEWSGYSQ